MKTNQLKNLVIDKISGINDKEFLEAIKKILDSSSSSGIVYKLSSEQKETIEAGKKQISEGKYITNEYLEKEEDKWLNE